MLGFLALCGMWERTKLVLHWNRAPYINFRKRILWYPNAPWKDNKRSVTIMSWNLKLEKLQLKWSEKINWAIMKKKWILLSPLVSVNKPTYFGPQTLNVITSLYVFFYLPIFSDALHIECVLSSIWVFVEVDYFVFLSVLGLSLCLLWSENTCVMNVLLFIFLFHIVMLRCCHCQLNSLLVAFCSFL